MDALPAPEPLKEILYADGGAEALKRTLRAITPQDIRGWFAHCGCAINGLGIRSRTWRSRRPVAPLS
jgi:hypothetical protein